MIELHRLIFKCRSSISSTPVSRSAGHLPARRRSQFSGCTSFVVRQKGRIECPNLLERNFHPDAPIRFMPGIAPVWPEGWLYLA